MLGMSLAVWTSPPQARGLFDQRIRFKLQSRKSNNFAMGGASDKFLARKIQPRPRP